MRFLIPELVDKNDKIMIIDPDVFAIRPIDKLDDIIKDKDQYIVLFTIIVLDLK